MSAFEWFILNKPTVVRLTRYACLLGHVSWFNWCAWICFSYKFKHTYLLHIRPDFDSERRCVFYFSCSFIWAQFHWKILTLIFECLLCYSPLLESLNQNLSTNLRPNISPNTFFFYTHSGYCFGVNFHFELYFWFLSKILLWSSWCARSLFSIILKLLRGLFIQGASGSSKVFLKFSKGHFIFWKHKLGLFIFLGLYFNWLKL